jgi:Ran GTPase-activating protein (RanGAP) involved in mRNA processing and transport
MLSAAGPPSSLPAKYPPRRPSAKGLLSSRSQIDYLDAGLHSIEGWFIIALVWICEAQGSPRDINAPLSGAQEIISTITSRPTVTKLILSHNTLEDDGCIVLFRFLGSDVGKTKRISEIKLAKNGIGDRGLLAISEFLKGNTVLKELYLPQNEFQNTPSVMSTFTSALNSSHLEKLNLSSNRHLSDSFAATLFPHLNSFDLRDVFLSIVGLTPLSVPDIVSYISSPRCRLHSLSLNGNALGFQGVTDIVRAVEKNNFGLVKVELYSNQYAEPGSEEIEATRENDQNLKRTLIRNQYLKRQTEKEALRLLVSARASLLQPKYQHKTTGTSFPSCPLSQSSVPILPTELQLHILSFLAPTLSSAQRIRIYTYASTFSTLPDILPRLASNSGSRGSECLPDPTHLGPSIGARNLNGWVLRQVDEQRERWLKAVGCDSFEREDPTSGNGETK